MNDGEGGIGEPRDVRGGRRERTEASRARSPRSAGDGGGGVGGVGGDAGALDGVDDDEDAAEHGGVLEERGERAGRSAGSEGTGSRMLNRRLSARQDFSRKWATSWEKLWSAKECARMNGGAARAAERAEAEASRSATRAPSSDAARDDVSDVAASDAERRRDTSAASSVVFPEPSAPVSTSVCGGRARRRARREPPARRPVARDRLPRTCARARAAGLEHVGPTRLQRSLLEPQRARHGTLRRRGRPRRPVVRHVHLAGGDARLDQLCHPRSRCRASKSRRSS